MNSAISSVCKLCILAPIQVLILVSISVAIVMILIDLCMPMASIL